MPYCVVHGRPERQQVSCSYQKLPYLGPSGVTDLSMTDQSQTAKLVASQTAEIAPTRVPRESANVKPSSPSPSQNFHRARLYV